MFEGLLWEPFLLFRDDNMDTELSGDHQVGPETDSRGRETFSTE